MVNADKSKVYNPSSINRNCPTRCGEENTSLNSPITIPVDGSPTRICYVINGKPIVENIDKGTSNEGEYLAVIGALNYLAHFKDFRGSVVVKSDSRLVVNQLSYVADVNAINLVLLYAIVKELEQNFAKVTYVWSPKNMAGDQLEKCRRNDRKNRRIWIPPEVVVSRRSDE